MSALYPDKLYIPVGIPGSGKSTWMKTMIPKAVIISSDAIRLNMFGSLKAAHDPEKKRINNDRVWSKYYYELEQSFSVYSHNPAYRVADATNLRDFARARLRDIAERSEVETHVVIFNNVEQALKRNKERPEDAIVPDEHMEVFAKQLEDAIFDIREKESYSTITKIGWVG